MLFVLAAFLVFSCRGMAQDGQAENGPGLNLTGTDNLWAGTAYMDSMYSTGAHLLHEIGITGYGVSAAVLDTPFDVTHEALRNPLTTGISPGALSERKKR